MGKKVMMAIVAHADDVEMSMGGTFLKYHELDYEMVYVMSTNNMSGAYAYLDENNEVASRSIACDEEMKVRKAEADKAAKECFGTTIIHLDHPQRHYNDENLESKELRYGCERPNCVPENVPSILTAFEDKEAIARVADLILERDPEVIVTKGRADTNPEHVCTGLLAERALGRAIQSGYDGTLIYSLTPAPIPSTAPFYNRYDTFIDTSGYYDEKLKAIGYHASQKPKPELLDMRDFDEGFRCGRETVEPFVLGHRSGVRTGPLTREIKQNHLYCVENYVAMFCRS